MAFEIKNLSVLAYANGFTLWHYTTPDAAVAVDNTGYFNAAADMLHVGDMLLANVATTGTPQNGVFAVASVVSGVVDVANMTAFDAADTD
jgi:outer membrane protein assembly factor BamB